MLTGELTGVPSRVGDEGKDKDKDEDEDEDEEGGDRSIYSSDTDVDEIEDEDFGIEEILCFLGKEMMFPAAEYFFVDRSFILVVFFGLMFK